jgi:hypothetical protein
MEKYYNFIQKSITQILSRKISDKTTYDIMDTDKNMKYKKIVLKEKQRQMKIGEIMQVVLGNYINFINLGNGHESGLDIMSIDRKIIIELKNRTNTDNASSRKSNLEKLSKFKIKNPDYMCVYGCINDDTKEKTITGKIDSIIYNDVEIKIYIGYKLLELILGDNVNEVIDYVKKTIDKLT